MIKPLKIALLTLQAALAHAQWWAPAGQPGVPATAIQQVATNEARNAIYLGGAFKIDSTLPWQQSSAVLRYSNGQWDTLGVINGLVLSVVEYQDTVIAGGTFNWVDDTVAVTSLAYHAGSGWKPYGNLSNWGVRKLRVLDDTLYMVGTFQYADSNYVRGIARRQGSQWVAVGTIPDPGAIVTDITKYNGRLVVIGSFTVNGCPRIAQFNGTQWVPVGPGIQGGLSGPHSILEYNGDLYVGGQISEAEGNVGHGIMRWDGTQFHALGDGLRYAPGSTVFTDVRGLQVHDGKLFVGGGFNFAGGLPSSGLATWDGVEWCVVPGDISSEGGSIHGGIAFYHDTLFIATTGDTIDGVYTNYAAKYIGATYEDTCSGPVGLEEQPTSNLHLHYDPATATLHLPTSEPLNLSSIELFDPLGRRVFSLQLHGQRQVSVAELAPGVYVARVCGAQGVAGSGRFVKH